MDEVQRMIVEVQNKERLIELQQVYKTLYDDVAKFNAEVARGARAANDPALLAAAGNMATLKKEIDSLIGKRGGEGVQGLSYAFQDAASQISQGGPNSFTRAMIAVSNNVDAVGRSLGLSVGQVAALSAGFTVLTLAMPAITEAFHRLSGSLVPSEEDVKKAKDALEEVRAEYKKTAEEWKAMMQAPDTFEKKAAEGLKGALKGEKGHRATEVVRMGISDDEAIASVDSEERKQMMSNAGINLAHPFGAPSEAELPPIQDVPLHQRAHYQMVAMERDMARRKRDSGLRDQLILKGRERRAQAVVTGATKPGEAGRADREQLLRLTKGVEGLDDLQQWTPEATAAREQGKIIDDWSIEGAQGAEKRGKQDQVVLDKQASAKERVQHLIKQRTEEKNREMAAQADERARDVKDKEHRDDKERREAEHARNQAFSHFDQFTPERGFNYQDVEAVNYARMGPGQRARAAPRMIAAARSGLAQPGIADNLRPDQRAEMARQYPAYLQNRAAAVRDEGPAGIRRVNQEAYQMKQAGNLQQQTGGDWKAAMAKIKQDQAGLERDRSEFVQTVVEAASGGQSERQLYRNATRRLRGKSTPSGAGN